MDWLNLLLDPNVAPGGAGAVADAAADPNLDPDAEPLPAEGDEPSGEEPPAEPGAGEGEPPEPEEGLEPEDKRVIPPWMRELKEKDPTAYNKAKGDLFDLRARRGIHASVDDARTEHNLIESLGGQEGIASLQTDAGVFKEAATQFLAGDPAFVKDLFDEDPIAAALHVPVMLDALRERDVEGYKGLIARIWHGEFNSVGLPQGLKALRAAVLAGNKDEAVKWLDSIVGWQEEISGLATKADDPRVKTLLAERAKSKQSADEAKHAEFLKGYRTNTINSVVESCGKVFDSFFKGKKLSNDDRTDLMREAMAIANRAVESDAAFKEQRDKHLERRDANSALQLTKSRYAKEFPEAVKRVARRYGLISGKPAANTARQPNAAGKGQPAAAGFVRVNERPDPATIDRSRTSPDDIISGKATLKDGRKVTWAHLRKPAA